MAVESCNDQVTLGLHELFIGPWKTNCKRVGNEGNKKE
ncbi:hypothetical protein COLO4_35354 [Corchorus olitorius]|uniref:Uncharacterized protein n=1 Tax=Corchorus olitorius TaxID=93759 RepID=A0A1R3GHA4_9ROSI|nr:hypothetical protein COLO4_35354 [Corchorus olitorius]